MYVFQSVQSQMSDMLLKCLFLLLAFRAKCQLQSFCDGKWEASNISDISSYPILAARNHYNLSTARESAVEFVNTACPAQVAHYTCYYHGDTQRAQNIEFKRFIPNPPTNDSDGCVSFHPLEFLELIRNRVVIFHGDSILGNVWTSLFCSLYSASKSLYSIDFRKLIKGGDILCPLGEAAHSYNQGGTIKFPHFNVTLHFALMNEYYSTFTKFIEFNKNYIIIYNTGLHYNEEAKFNHDMKEAASALSNYFTNKRHRNETIPLLFFAETTPQHFNTTANGYYDEIALNHKGSKQCVPTVKEGVEGHNFTRLLEADWRNRTSQNISHRLSNKAILQSFHGQRLYMINMINM
jgi:hypothetical protein